jgi:hypothetical protein
MEYKPDVYDFTEVKIAFTKEEVQKIFIGVDESTKELSYNLIRYTLEEQFPPLSSDGKKDA